MGILEKIMRYSEIKRNLKQLLSFGKRKVKSLIKAPLTNLKMLKKSFMALDTERKKKVLTLAGITTVVCVYGIYRILEKRNGHLPYTDKDKKYEEIEKSISEDDKEFRLKFKERLKELEEIKKSIEKIIDTSAPYVIESQIKSFQESVEKLKKGMDGHLEKMKKSCDEESNKFQPQLSVISEKNQEQAKKLNKFLITFKVEIKKRLEENKKRLELEDVSEESFDDSVSLSGSDDEDYTTGEGYLKACSELKPLN